MLVLGLGLGLKAKFCGLGLGLGLGNVALALALEVWPWPKIQGQNIGGLQCSPRTLLTYLLTYCANTGDSTHFYVTCQ